MRIVSLTCSNTEIVCALGCADWLVGVDDHSDYPESVVQSLPRVGPDLSVDIAAISALQPDLVLASLTVPGHEHNLANLKAARLPHSVTQPTSLTGVRDDILHIGRLLGVPERAERLVSSLQPLWDARHQPVPANAPRVLIQWWPKPVIAPGQRSWAQDLITAAGGINVLADRDCESEPLTDEQVAALNPDVIVIAWCGVKLEKYRPDVVYRNPAFSAVTAIQKQQVYCVSEAYLGRPSPRLLAGWQQLKTLIQSIQGQ